MTGMESSRAIRVVGFFVAGLVIAVGSALIYLTAQQSKQPVEVAQNTRPPQYLALPEPLPVGINIDKARASNQAAVQRNNSGIPLPARAWPAKDRKTTTAQK